MKATPISKYLDQMGRASGADSPLARREASPFKPRAVPAAVQNAPHVAPLLRRSQAPDEGASPISSPLYDRRDADSAQLDAAMVRVREAAAGPDMEARLAEAYRRGLQDGSDAATADAARARAMERVERQKQTAVERLDFQMNEYARLAEVIDGAFSEVERRIAASVSAILQPFLRDALADQALEALADDIARLREGAPAGLIKIRGPERLLAELRKRVATHPVDIEYSNEEGVDVTVEAQPTMIRTRLSGWGEFMASLSQAN